jgi:hypothetical protein
MRYRYHNSNAGRVSGGASEADKGRYTAVLAADGLGRPAPGAFIVRVKPTTKHDMSKCRTVQAIGAKLGWPARLWEREINGTVHKRWVAQDPVTGAFVTSHSTAWMDTTGMVMYAELIGPRIAAARKPGKRYSLLLMDNHSSHDQRVVVDEFAKFGIILLPLPPNATDFLQVRVLVRLKTEILMEHGAGHGHGRERPSKVLHAPRAGCLQRLHI